MHAHKYLIQGQNWLGEGESEISLTLFRKLKFRLFLNYCLSLLFSINFFVVSLMFSLLLANYSFM